MKELYVTIKKCHHEISGDSKALSKLISFNDFIEMVSQPEFFSVTIKVMSDPVIPDHQITLMKGVS